MQKLWRLLAMMIPCLGFATHLMAQDWGDLSAEFVFEGTPPMLPAFAVQNKDCAVFPNPDESLVVNPKNKGIEYIVMYLKKAPAAVHPDLAKAPATPVVINQKKCQFVPHVTMIRTGQQVSLVSLDEFAHNVKGAPFGGSDEFNILLAAMATSTAVLFTKPDLTPVKAECNVHGHMVGHWLNIDHPYGAVSDADGKLPSPAPSPTTP